MTASDPRPISQAGRRLELAIERLTPVALVQRPWRQGGMTRVTLIVKTTFRLEPGARATLLDAEPFAARGSVVADSELAPYLPSAGVTIRGVARPSGKSVAREMTVRVSIRAPATGQQEPGVLFDKALLVVGDRGSHDQIADVFDEIPLIDELAVGGPASPENPLGVGTGGDGPQANILPIDRSLRYVGLGPVPRDRPERKRRAPAGFDPEGSTLVTVPDDVDWRYFHVATADQQIPYLGGHEWIRLEGFDASHPCIESQLPGVVPRARLRRSARAGVEEIVLLCDYLAIDTETRVCSLLWRGNVAIGQDELADARAVIGLESAPRSLGWPEGFATLASVPNEASDPHDRPTPSSVRPLRSTKVLAAGDIADALQRPDTPFRPSSAPEPARSSRLPPPPEVYPVIAPPPPLGPSIMGVAPPSEPPRPARLDGQVVAPSVPPPPPPASVLPTRSVDAATPPSPSRREIKPSPRRTEVLTRLHDGKSLEGLDLSGTDLSGVDFAGASLRGVDLRDARLAESLFQDVDLSGARLDGADLTRADLSGANLDRASFRRANLTATHLERTKLADGVFDEASGRGLTLRGATGARTSFSGCSFEECDFTGIQIEKADFGGATLSAVTLTDAKLERARFDQATLTRVTFDGARLPSSRWFGAKLLDCSCRQVSFSRAHFAGAELTRCRLSSSDLRDVDLRGVHCSEVDLSGADLREIDLEGARLSGCKLAEAQLTGACLRSVSAENVTLDAAKLAGARLEDATLTNASMVGAQLRGARADRAILAGANLTRADLSFTSFRAASLSGADLSFSLVDGADFTAANLTGACLFRVDQTRACFDGASREGIDTVTDRRRQGSTKAGD